MCETFNAVIREAKDKPILTQMEWLRRYMMKRSNDKWEAACKWEGLLTPYVYKLFDGLEKYVRACTVHASRGDTYEVQYKDDQCSVDLQARTCTCYRWELTGIPCVHAFACILDRRDDLELFVHTHYYRVTYLDAYESPIQPMPGPKHWERVKLTEPLPPQLKVQPRRPKSKKRKFEQGERTSAATSQGKKQKFKKQCGNCGGFEHYAKTCQKPPAPEQPQQPAPNPKEGRPELHTPWMKEQRKKREQKAASQAALIMPLSQPSTTAASASASQREPSTRSKKKSLSQPTQPPQAPARTRAKLPITRNKMKNLSSL